MSDGRTERLREFTEWTAKHIKGDEKGEAQVFLDRLFQGFGQKGVKEAGAELEMRVKKEDQGGTAFADLVWKPIVLVEMKRRGADLRKHYRQAFDYWTRLVPGRPRYVVLCNFDEFWVFDFETQMDEPVDRVALVDLPQRYGPLAFLFPTNEVPVFGNDQEAVTREAADRLAACFNMLVARGVPRPEAQAFILQVLVALFAEDIGLLDKYLVTRLLDECKKPRDSYDLLGGLFVEMNTKGKTPGGRFAGVDYFNGGLFAQPARLELRANEVEQLRAAAKFDWSQVRPEIFGTIFEHSLDHGERHAFGAHFTSPVDIMKIVGPTIVEPWRDVIEGARGKAEIQKLLQRLRTFRVLDPACGSGNFLYIAYRELKRLEARAFERLGELSRGDKDKHQLPFGFVMADQFFGLDINPFAVELAKVTMMIARKLAIDELHVTEPPLPLANLDANFAARDALIGETGLPAAWPKADVIIGNPPFLGAKRLKPERGIDYVNAVRAAYPDVPGMADYCVYWFRRAHDHLPPCTGADPVTGRAGLVGTQNIRNNQSRVGGLDHVVKLGTIVEAVDNQPWSGEANVHVSIANWVKTQDKALLPKTRRLWQSVAPAKGGKKVKERRKGPASKRYELALRDVKFINSTLSDLVDVSGAKVLACNTAVGPVCQGITPGQPEFVISAAEAAALAKADRTGEAVPPYLIGRELVSGDARPKRHVIDFRQRDMLEAKGFAAAFKRVEASVLPKIQQLAAEEDAGETARKDQLERWWMHWRPRPELIDAIARLSRYLVCSRVTKRPIFVFMHPTIRPGDAVQVFAFEDDYSFGVLQSGLHWAWFVQKCSKLKSDFRYTPPSVFDTFPWPQAPKAAHVESVAAAGREIRAIRANALPKVKGGLRELYRTTELPGTHPLKDAHAKLDAAVARAYGFEADGDPLAQLLDLNADVAARIAKGLDVTAPGVPAGFPKPKDLVSDDCVQP